jgi:hypothetical protein
MAFPRKSGLHRTPRWREQDSNHRSRVTRPIFQCRLWLVPRQPKSRSEREPTHEASGPSPAGPMVRILFPPAASLQTFGPCRPILGVRSCHSREFEHCEIVRLEGGDRGFPGRSSQKLRKLYILQNCQPLFVQTALKPAIARAQPQLPVPGDVSDPLGLALLPQQQLAAEPGRETVAPCRLDQQPAGGGVAGLGDVCSRRGFATSPSCSPTTCMFVFRIRCWSA